MKRQNLPRAKKDRIVERHNHVHPNWTRNKKKKNSNYNNKSNIRINNIRNSSNKIVVVVLKTNNSSHMSSPRKNMALHNIPLFLKYLCGPCFIP